MTYRVQVKQHDTGEWKDDERHFVQPRYAADYARDVYNGWRWRVVYERGDVVRVAEDATGVPAYKPLTDTTALFDEIIDAYEEMASIVIAERAGDPEAAYAEVEAQVADWRARYGEAR